jgi:hypothetical protein
VFHDSRHDDQEEDPDEVSDVWRERMVSLTRALVLERAERGGEKVCLTEGRGREVRDREGRRREREGREWEELSDIHCSREENKRNKESNEQDEVSRSRLKEAS